jgi:uncharacterized damage-inducible protein DinB
MHSTAAAVLHSIRKTDEIRQISAMIRNRSGRVLQGEKQMLTKTAPVCLGLILMAGGAEAQPPAAADVSSAIRQNWDGAKRNLRESAEKMEETNYAFKPVDSVRSFGQILAHVSGASYVFCSSAKGEKSPFSEEHFEKTATTKAAIVKAVADSIAYCDTAYGSLTDTTAAQPVTMPFGMGNAPRASALIMNIGHVQEHYGNLVTYFRIKGVVPPSSAR